MSETQSIQVPELGDFDEVEVIEVAIKPGDQVGVEDGLITLETDKAAMDVPSPYAGEITEVSVAVGDRVKAGDVIAKVQVADAAAVDDSASEDTTVVVTSGRDEARELRPSAAYSGAVDHKTELLVLGAGVAGYTAAFRAADLGMEVTLVERWPSLGGVCLNVGCIPSKALLHAAKVVDDAAGMAAHGITFGPP
ncbi:MAG: FAD-dependent oxidoreductase, partial [Gammaproteobacteria bacterium]|nr:FAD-dependent oxidoreductase [Gammaproteobacteria bacterium]